jgi:hypothetical protein
MAWLSKSLISDAKARASAARSRQCFGSFIKGMAQAAPIDSFSRLTQVNNSKTS